MGGFWLRSDRYKRVSVGSSLCLGANAGPVQAAGGVVLE